MESCGSWCLVLLQSEEGDEANGESGTWGAGVAGEGLGGTGAGWGSRGPQFPSTTGGGWGAGAAGTSQPHGPLAFADGGQVWLRNPQPVAHRAGQTSCHPPMAPKNMSPQARRASWGDPEKRGGWGALSWGAGTEHPVGR